MDEKDIKKFIDSFYNAAIDFALFIVTRIAPMFMVLAATPGLLILYAFS